MTRLEKAKQAVLDRMNGCPLPNCHACRANRESIDELVAAAQEAVR